MLYPVFAVDVTDYLIWVTATILMASFLIPHMLSSPRVQGGDQAQEGVSWAELKGRLARVRLTRREVEDFQKDAATFADWAIQKSEIADRLRQSKQVPLNDMEAWEVWEFTALSPSDFAAVAAKLALALALKRSHPAIASDATARASLARLAIAALCEDETPRVPA